MDSRLIARTLAEEAIVLLKNEDMLLHRKTLYFPGMVLAQSTRIVAGVF